MAVSDFPELFVDFGFAEGASTGNYWHIGDAARGIVGTFAIAGDQVWSDVTGYTQHLILTTGTSSRVTTPLVEFEGGTASITLNNAAAPPLVTAAFDPLNTQSPFYTQADSHDVPVPGTFPNATESLATVDAFDATVTSASTNLTYAAAGFAAVGVAANTGTATGLSTFTGPSGMLFGSSGFAGAPAATSTLNLLDPAIGRSYESMSTTSYAGTQYAKNIPAGLAQYMTFKGNTKVWADPSSDQTTYNTQRDNARKVLGGLSARKGHRSGYWHEPVSEVNAGTYTIAEWVLANINFKHDVIDYVNASRANPIWCAPCNNGFPTDQQQNLYYPNTLLAVIDEINWDCYGFAGGQDQVLRCHNFAVSKGLPWSVGELGYTTDVPAASVTDAQQLGVMQGLAAHIQSWPVSERPGFVSWFNAGTNLLNGKTQSIAYYKNLCENSTVQPA